MIWFAILKKENSGLNSTINRKNNLLSRARFSEYCPIKCANCKTFKAQTGVAMQIVRVWRGRFSSRHRKKKKKKKRKEKKKKEKGRLKESNKEYFGKDLAFQAELFLGIHH